MTTRERLAILKEAISRQVGAHVDITIRGETSFTFSTETVMADIEDRIRAFLGSAHTYRTEHDDECGSFCYLDA